MKRLTRLAARLYPRAWRERYGAEFEALLEDSTPRAGDVADIVIGATSMQMKMWNSYGRVALAAGVLCALIAFCASFAIKRQFMSIAVLQLRGADGSVLTGAEGTDRLNQLQLAVINRDAMVDIIKAPDLNLYTEERQRMPMEDVAEDMIHKHVEISPLSDKSKKVSAILVGFESDDAVKAQAVTARLVTAFQTQASRSKDGDGLTMAVLDKPWTRPTVPARGKMAFEGALAGTLLGMLTLLVWRRFRRASV